MGGLLAGALLKCVNHAASIWMGCPIYLLFICFRTILASIALPSAVLLLDLRTTQTRDMVPCKAILKPSHLPDNMQQCARNLAKVGQSGRGTKLVWV